MLSETNVVLLNSDCVINMMEGWLTWIWFAFCGRWIRGKCRWRIECVPWLWLTLLTTSGCRRPAKAHRTGCSRWNNHTLKYTNTPWRQTKMLQTLQGSIPRLPSHHVISPSGELRSEILLLFNFYLHISADLHRYPWPTASLRSHREPLFVCFPLYFFIYIYIFFISPTFCSWVHVNE